MLPATHKNIACLLIHGYLGSPFEVEPLVQPLRDMGFAVYSPTLPGHESTIEEFRKNNFDTWSSFVESQYDKIALEHEAVIVIGLSLGGSFALHLAAKRSPLAAVVIDAAVFPPCAWLKQLWNWAKLFFPPATKISGNKTFKPWTPESNNISPWRGYTQVFHPGQFINMFSGFCRLRSNLRHITAPLLIMHDLRDIVVTIDNALAIMHSVASKNCKLEITRVQENESIHHVLTTHCETKNFVINNTRNFIATVCGMPAPGAWPKND